jgi:dTMP kinase
MPGGRFIALEGIDGSGTTRQCSALAAALRDRGHEVLETHEPSDRSIGRVIRERLSLGAEPTDPWALALLFAADRIDHVECEIEPALRRGEVVICDRYVMSSLVYQSLECDPLWVQSINRRAPWPDLTFVLQVAPEVALERTKRRARAGGPALERFEIPDTQRALARAYAEAAARPDLPGIRPIDGHAPIETVTAALVRACVALGL